MAKKPLATNEAGTRLDVAVTKERFHCWEPHCICHASGHLLPMVHVTFHIYFQCNINCRLLCLLNVQGDSLTRGPKLVYLQILNEFVNQLTDDELTTGYYQQDGATCHTSNAGMREIESFFKDRIILKKKKPLATRISRSNICRLLSMGPIEGQSV